MPVASPSAQRVTDRKPERQEERRLERPNRGHLTDDGRFAIDLSRVPKGFVMEFKRHSIFGARDRRNLAIIAENHWEKVPHKMQPHVLGITAESEDEHIVVDGLGLYMRPAYLNEDAEQEQQENTLYQTNQQLQSLRLQSKDQVGPARTYIKKSVAQVPQAVE